MGESATKQQEVKLSFKEVELSTFQQHVVTGEAPSDTPVLQLSTTISYPKESIRPIGASKNAVQYLLKVPYLSDGHVPDTFRTRLFALTDEKKREIEEIAAPTLAEAKINRKVSILLGEMVDYNEAPAPDYVLIYAIATDAKLKGGVKEALVQALREIGNKLEKELDPENINSILNKRK